MSSLPGAGDWLVVLPDHPDASPLTAALADAPRRVDHPSGRPWLVGRWADVDLRIGTAGAVKIAALGFCAAGPDLLTRVAARTRDVHDLDSLALPGCFHLLATVAGHVRAQGTVSGLRRLVHTRIGGITVAATRADVLALVTGAGIDDRRLPLSMVVSEVPLHTLNHSLWRGIEAVDEDCCLLIAPDGRARTRVRWTPPRDELPLAEAADRLRVALDEAVRARTASGLALTNDLSGGLDSTTLCFLTARDGRAVTAVTKLAVDLGDDDPLWADLAAEHLPGLRRITLPLADIPTHYSDLLDTLPPAEEPFPGVEDRPTFRVLAARVAAEGSQAHMTGEGGDEVLLPGSTGVVELLRTRPVTALRLLRGYRALSHWRWRDVARMVWDRRLPYPRWLAERAQRIVASPLEGCDVKTVLQLPPWATPAAVAATRDLLARAADSARQLGHNQTVHHTVWGIRLCAALVRRTSPLYAAEGVRVTAPFLDDAVITACLSGRAHERRTPWEYKPILRPAMRGIVPDRCLARNTKAEGSNVEHTGLRVNADRLAALCHDSRLAELGLVDADRLRQACTGSVMSLFTPYAISVTMSTERWLRDLDQPASVHPSTVEIGR
ncbi:asparagine synthase-related protein [Actinosynnema sp. CS-041913]|uniref:asparagine synthase-related protein n=1 Tax=Actinosynnema sp. CS-041913 TaxID=3239917 RepID=UPI003D90AE72